MKCEASWPNTVALMAIKPRRCWDTACAFGYLADQSGRAEQCQRVIDDAESGHSDIVISALTIAEVLHLKGEKRGLPSETRDRIRSFFRRSCFTVADVDRFIAEHAQDLYWEHQVMPKDAIHVATAIAAGAHYLETFDGVLLKKSRQLGGDPQLVVQNPGEDIVKAAAAVASKRPPELLDGITGRLSS